MIKKSFDFFSVVFVSILRLLNLPLRLELLKIFLVVVISPDV